MDMKRKGERAHGGREGRGTRKFKKKKPGKNRIRGRTAQRVRGTAHHSVDSKRKKKGDRGSKPDDTLEKQGPRMGRARKNTLI